MSDEKFVWVDSEFESSAEFHRGELFRLLVFQVSNPKHWQASIESSGGRVYRPDCPSREYAKGWCEGAFLTEMEVES